MTTTEKRLGAAPDPATLDPAERMGVDELRDLQVQRLQASLRHAYDNVPHYRQAFDARDLAGTVVLVGVPNPTMSIELPLIEVFGRGGAVKSSWYGDCLPSRDFPMLTDLYLQGRFPLEDFVSETIGIGDVEEAFAKMHAGEVLRSVVVFES